MMFVHPSVSTVVFQVCEKFYFDDAGMGEQYWLELDYSIECFTGTCGRARTEDEALHAVYVRKETFFELTDSLGAEAAREGMGAGDMYGWGIAGRFGSRLQRTNGKSGDLPLRRP
ncbi:hypothetical protein CYMTET_40528 [Cymbomonas tetramitiformis]|uniref:Uncharacterized protein n=1 Tax=Cymbomonas tetramitiformis TaxID=36881 RepID=A0AAE0F358_9CHLO|nr:hypothetical protein CYMTET_40528 [Cymbomonas tetramitiformis]